MLTTTEEPLQPFPELREKRDAREDSVDDSGDKCSDFNA